MNALCFGIGILCGMSLYKAIRESLIRNETVKAEQEEARNRRMRRHGTVNTDGYERLDLKIDDESGAEWWIR